MRAEASLEQPTGFVVADNPESTIVLADGSQHLFEVAPGDIEVLDELAYTFVANRLYSCRMWTAWPGASSSGSSIWQPTPFVALRTPLPIISRIGSYLVLANAMNGEAVAMSEYCIAQATDARFGGKHVWIGPLIDTAGISIQRPTDVPYIYEKVTKSALGFDINKAIRVIICRHGETFANAWGIFQGNSNETVVGPGLVKSIGNTGQEPSFEIGETVRYDLNDNGRKDAQALATAIQNVLFGRAKHVVILSSPLDRAVQTARVLAEATRRDITVLDDLHEASAPRWEGKHGDGEIRNADLSHALWVADPYKYSPPDGETANDVVTRVDNALRSIINLASPGSTVVVYTHKGFLLWMLERYLGSVADISESELSRQVGEESKHWKVRIPNAAWTELYLYEGRALLPDDGRSRPYYFPLNTPDLTPNATAIGELL